MNYSAEHIENYLAGEMSSSEQAAFELAMGNDPALAKAVALSKRLETVLADDGEWALRQTLAKIRSAEVPLEVKDSPAAPSGTSWWKVGLPLFVAALVALVYWYSGSTIDQPVEVERNEELSPLPTPAPALPLDIETPTAPAADSLAQPVQKDAPTTPPVLATRGDAFKQNLVLEKLALQEGSVVYDFKLTARRYRTNGTNRLAVSGPLFALSIPQDGFLLEVYDNAPTNFPSSPRLTQRLVPTEVKETEVKDIAFARKKSYVIVFDEPFEFPTGRYYFVIRAAPGQEVLEAGVIE